jgi:serine/threonine-protein kinase
VGIYVIADPTVAARAIQILTPTKGWVGSVYVAKRGRCRRRSTAGGRSSGTSQSAKASQRVDLDTAGNRFRYYLVWITKLPPGADQVQISEIRPLQVGAAKSGRDPCGTPPAMCATPASNRAGG